MQFGRVDGFVSRTNAGRHALVVLLTTGRSVCTVRDGVIDAALLAVVGDDPDQLADQFVQETIGNELAEDGWELIGEAGTAAANAPTAPTSAAIGRSKGYVVRRV